MWEHGMYSPLFYPSSIPCEIKYPVSFVGTCMDNRVALITYLLEKDIPIHVFGNGWDIRSNLPKRFPLQFHSAVEGKEYADVIRQSQICLGLVSHSSQDEWTMRSYEVPACARLLLAERTPSHQVLFREDVDAVFFSDAEESANKSLALLANPIKCEQMGHVAYKIFILQNKSMEKRMKQLIQQILD